MAEVKFDGTALAASHIGETASKRLANVVNTAQAKLDITVAAEVTTTTSTLTYQLQDGDDVALAEGAEVLLELLDADLDRLAETAYTIAVSGGATLKAGVTAARAAAAFSLSAAGAGVATITDVVGTSTDLIFAKSTIINRDGLVLGSYLHSIQWAN